MWIMLPDCFVSIVVKGPDPNLLLVRARRRGDIERFIRDANVSTDRGADYRFRATIQRSYVAQRLASKVRDVDYTNFKASVGDERLHLAYMTVWRTMAGLQS